MESRKDSFTCMVVDYGIQIAGSDGAKAGAAYMAHWGVPFEVAHRVLVLKLRRK